MANFWKTYCNKSVLVFKDQNDDCKPIITIMTETSDGGYISQNIIFATDDEGWDKRDKAFKNDEVMSKFSDNLLVTATNMLEGQTL